MSESEDAERFTRELDELLDGREPARGAGDPALDVARRLLKTDFSASSGLRPALRARLLGARRRPWPAPFLRPLLAGAGAACVLLAAALIIRFEPARRSAPTSYPLGESGLPVLPGRFEARPAGAMTEVFTRVAGVEVSGEGGRAVVWDFGDAVYRLESRRITTADIFEKPDWRGEL